MKKRFLPLSLLLVMLMLGQASVIAGNGGHYVPRVQGEATADSYMSQLRANQHTGLIDPALMIEAAQSANENESKSDLNWINMGPDNFGGQTTAIVYDNASGVVYIGSKGGGIYKSSNNGITWHQIGGMNLMVSCMVKGENGVIYVGTGDGGSAASYNGLSDLSYDNGFIGTGVYKLENDVLTQISSTNPTVLNGITDWSFVNDLAYVGGKLVAATESGLKYSTDNGATWNTAVAGLAMEVKAMADNKVIAAVDGKVYIGNLDNLVCCSAGSEVQMNENGDIISIPEATSWLDVAAAPSDANVVFASCLDKNGVHAGVYVSYNQGQTWNIALPAINSNFGHNIYANFGLNNNGLVVNPTNPHLVYVLGYNLWELRKPQGNGYYLAVKCSTSADETLPAYLHVGLQCMTFNPDNSNECYIGTDGGVFKGIVGQGFEFRHCNRNYISTRMFNIAYSNVDYTVLGAAQDHGSILVEGDPFSNTIISGAAVYPNPNIHGTFTDDYQPGECAFSMINPSTIFVSYKAGGFERSDKTGDDWISTNFLSEIGSLSTTAYHFPYVLVEDFEDEDNPSEVWFKNTTSQTLTGIVQVMSANNYPFEAELTAPLAPKDSVLIHDPISAKLYVAIKDKLYMTRGALNFAAAPKWYLVSSNRKPYNFSGHPQSIAVSADGDKAYVGFQDGKLFRVENINVMNDSTVSINDTANFPVRTIRLSLPVDGQCITSISLDPRNENKMVVTLGNYGNDAYVLYTENATAANPTFVVKQGNLPKMPVYSSVVEMANGYVIVGTEHGIYMTENIAAGTVNWVSANKDMGDVPVMDLKQQRIFHEKQNYIYHNNTITYPGVYNTGVIYAATYGKGMFRCETFKQDMNSPHAVEEQQVAEMKLGMYPNPASTDAKISFDVKDNANVSYVVYDITGRMVMNQNLGNFSEGSYEASVNVSNLRSGSYILRLNQGANSSCVKFMVY